MTSASDERDKLWARLAEPFPPDEIEKLPKVLSRNDQQKGRCSAAEHGRYVSADGHFCGGWHSRAVHLDYVGHAGITMRLNEVVGPDGWDWEPVAVDEVGLPLARNGEFWIKLTVLGVTKYGVGDDFHGSSKQAIGDALRNAAMRFGIGTYLWSKSDKAASMAEFTAPPADATAPERQGQPLAQAPQDVPPEPSVESHPPVEEGDPGGTDPVDGDAGVDKTAQALVETASRARAYNTLKTLHGQAYRKGILGAPVVHPTLTGVMTTVSAYLQERKADLTPAEGQQ